MIKRIEVWDFESHKHTVIDDLSPGINLFCGASNSGKSSIIRALRVAAYNQFDIKSVRVGASKCVIQVDTDKGRVKVTRGTKHNLWEVTKTGEQTSYFDKVGTNIVPQAAEVMGLSLVELGDTEVPVNIMDQLESHFMLSGIGNKDATGSMRAQIVDEVSGLSGIEGVIKEVSLDVYRHLREVKESEEKVNETKAQLHPEDEIQDEKEILEKIDLALSDNKTLSDAVDAATSMIQETKLANGITDATRKRVASFPDVAAANELSLESERKHNLVVSAQSMFNDIEYSIKSRDGIRNKIASIPNVELASIWIENANVVSDRMGAIQKFVCEVEVVRSNVEKLKNVVIDGDATSKSDILSETATSISDRISLASNVLSLILEARTRVSSLRLGVGKIDELLRATEKEKDVMLDSIKVCPVTLRPMSASCMEVPK